MVVYIPQTGNLTGQHTDTSALSNSRLNYLLLIAHSDTLAVSLLTMQRDTKNVTYAGLCLCFWRPGFFPFTCTHNKKLA